MSLILFKAVVGIAIYMGSDLHVRRRCDKLLTAMAPYCGLDPSDPVQLPYITPAERSPGVSVAIERDAESDTIVLAVYRNRDDRTAYRVVQSELGKHERLYTAARRLISYHHFWVEVDFSAVRDQWKNVDHTAEVVCLPQPIA